MFTQNVYLSFQAENEVQELTKQLEELEDELDSAESTLAEVRGNICMCFRHNCLITAKK